MFQGLRWLWTEVTDHFCLILDSGILKILEDKQTRFYSSCGAELTHLPSVFRPQFMSPMLDAENTKVTLFWEICDLPLSVSKDRFLFDAAFHSAVVDLVLSKLA